MSYTLRKDNTTIVLEDEGRARNFLARGYTSDDLELESKGPEASVPLEAPAEPSEAGTTVVLPDSLHPAVTGDAEFVDSTVKPGDEKAEAHSDAPVKRPRKRKE